MKFARTGLSRQFGDILRCNSRAGINREPFARGFHQYRELRHALHCRFFSTRSQNSLRPAFHHVFQSFGLIGALVKRAMERDGKWLGHSHEFRGALHIHASALRQQTQDNSGRPGGFSRGTLFSHPREFRLRISKIARSGANHHEDRNADLFPHSTQKFEIGRQPSGGKIAAEFKAIRAFPLGGRRDNDSSRPPAIRRLARYVRHKA